MEREIERIRFFVPLACVPVIFLTFSCSQNKPGLSSLQNKPSVTTVSYSISSLSGRSHSVDRKTFRTISFNETGSVTTEITAVSGFSDTAEFYRKPGDSLMIVSQDLPWAKAVFTMKNEISSYFPDSLGPVLTNENDTILGYPCRKAIISRGAEKWEIWFTGEVQVRDPTNTIIAHPEINGFILKMIRSFSFDELYAATAYEVKDLKIRYKSPGFEPPDERSVYKGSLPPRDYYQQQFDSLTARQDTIPWQFKDRFLGKWKYPDKRLSVEVERYGEVYVVRLNSVGKASVGQEKRCDPVTARFYDRKLWFMAGNKWEWIKRCNDDKLCSSLCDSCRLSRI